MSSRSEVLTEMLRTIDSIHGEMMVTISVGQTYSHFFFHLPAGEDLEQINDVHGKAVLNSDKSNVRMATGLDRNGTASEPSKVPPTPCEQAILELFEEKQERLSKGQILIALDDARTCYSESAVAHALADMTRRKGWLSNRKDSYGKGYGLPDWS